MNKKIMILGASILQLPAIEKAKEMGLDVVVVDMNPNAIGFEISGIKKEIISTIDIPAIIEAAKRHQIDGIMTLATDMPMRSVAAVAEQMGLVGIDKDTAVKATNKAEMRKALQKAGVPIPKFFVVSNEEEYKEAVKEFDVPFIVKPADSSGSRGIFEVIDITNAELVKKAYEYCKPYSKVGDVVVEEYMNGPEVSAETLTINGVCHVIQITDKLTTGAPHYVEMGHSQPTKHSDEIASRIAEIAKEANKAIGIKNGPSHTEIIVTSQGPKVVELGARLGGDNITTHLVPLSTGVNMVECCIKIALGEMPDIKHKWSRGSAIRYFEQHAGIIESIQGIDKAKRIPGIQQISIVHGAGERITEIESSGSRMGFVIAQSSDAESAIKICTDALALITTNYL
ncbi:ATP-grasp domain-containing protein [Streptococcus pasteurianus]|uniref:ATP-grasp domain-containing protein n=1 Tax=Streptococcus TaxID=1301 RepID=UPI000E3F610D|nr:MULTISPECIES: ATP-grasp domain-containing protein [Streptococcus]MCH1618619.1 ATP-grasp domain-containing protein [Streptococcus gallolyticus]MCI7516524.1 ATP-grasp domain-containing protein [Streptococcus sp.]MCO7183506.1 ATP-grasp domain-containing protein [Streptococcus gallolyticus]MDV5118115.1 ATP-grasp domain-containing protein [Streptococcus pasteurianus]MDV5155956.1 ATP-grasp domain-containing protein [Streptococcus pasteurianus]